MEEFSEYPNSGAVMPPMPPMSRAATTLGVGDMQPARTHSTVPTGTRQQDVESVWSSVSEYVEKQLLNNKGVTIPGLGTFTKDVTRVEIGTNQQMLSSERPVFVANEKFAQTHGLKSGRRHVPTTIPVSTLNYSAISMETPYSRDLVERSVKDAIIALEMNIHKGKNVDFSFHGIGRLLVKDGRVKMRFRPDFINQFDRSGKLVDSLRNRPGTADSVMSRADTRSQSRSQTQMGGIDKIPRPQFDPISEEMENAINESEFKVEGAHIPMTEEVDYDFTAENPVKLETDNSGDPDLVQHVTILEDVDLIREPEKLVSDFSDIRENAKMSRERQSPNELYGGNQRQERPTSGYSAANYPVGRADFVDMPDLIKSIGPGRQRSPASPIKVGSAGSLPRRTPSVASAPAMNRSFSVAPAADCSHSGGQELCYLCYQRASQNVSVDTKALLKAKDAEENRFWATTDKLADTLHREKEARRESAKRGEAAKVAAYNVGIAEAKKEEKLKKEEEEPRQFVMVERPRTAPRHGSAYLQQLKYQITEKHESEKRHRQENDVISKMEQLQLAESLAQERERYLRQKFEQLQTYKAGLDDQRINKVPQIPGKYPDSSEPVFGRFEGVDYWDKVARAKDAAASNLDVVAAKKREALLRKLSEQRMEESAVRRARDDLQDDRMEKYMRISEARRCLEKEWLDATAVKKQRDSEERRKITSSPGCLMHEQVDGHKRCRQCKRRTGQVGETNLWKESFFIPGTRYIL